MLVGTTDVQSGTVTVSHQNLTVTCRFIVGSKSQGCYFQIAGQNDRFIVRRKEGQTTAMESFKISEHIVDMTGFVYDWEEDGTVGTLGIPVRATVEPTKSQAMDTVGLSPKNGTGNMDVTGSYGTMLKCILFMCIL